MEILGAEMVKCGIGVLLANIANVLFPGPFEKSFEKRRVSQKDHDQRVHDLESRVNDITDFKSIRDKYDSYDSQE